LIFLVNQKYGARNHRQLELAQMIVQDLIIDLGLPLSIVEHPAFLRAMNTIDPRFTVLSRRTLCRESLSSTLEQVEGEGEYKYKQLPRSGFRLKFNRFH
jgi:hypothetical protein